METESIREVELPSSATVVACPACGHAQRLDRIAWRTKLVLAGELTGSCRCASCDTQLLVRRAAI